MQTQAPINYVRDVAGALQWPVIVCAAFWVGRSMAKFEVRVLKAEKTVQDLVSRHMPHIHNALSEIKAVLQTLASRR